MIEVFVGQKELIRMELSPLDPEGLLSELTPNT